MSAWGTVTVTVCGEPVRVVWALPAVSVIENDAAAVSVEVTAAPPVTAVDIAVTVHTVDEVWVMSVMAEIPDRSKSVPAVDDSDAQEIVSLPVTVNVMVVDDDVAADAANVTAGAVASYKIESSADSGAASELFAESVARV